MTVVWLPRCCERFRPHSFIYFAINPLGAAGGVQVTASHNPRGDNGIKVYSEGGLQIVAPWDDEIAQAMQEVASATVHESDAATHASIIDVTQEIHRAYHEALHARRPQSDAHQKVTIAYTACYGVGAAPFREACNAAGFTQVHFHPEECRIDGHFPGMPAPNPENPQIGRAHV